MAEFDYVSVNNYGDVWNSDGDGIHAHSTAVAVAKVDQEANQTNTTEQSGTTTASPSTVSLNQEPDQANSNDQDGVAISVASADDVKVNSEGFVDPPGDGIHAELTRLRWQPSTNRRRSRTLTTNHQPKWVTDAGPRTTACSIRKTKPIRMVLQ